MSRQTLIVATAFALLLFVIHKGCKATEYFQWQATPHRVLSVPMRDSTEELLFAEWVATKEDTALENYARYSNWLDRYLPEKFNLESWRFWYNGQKPPKRILNEKNFLTCFCNNNHSWGGACLRLGLWITTEPMININNWELNHADSLDLSRLKIQF